VKPIMPKTPEADKALTGRFEPWLKISLQISTDQRPLA
jgi:hypothetical protein